MEDIHVKISKKSINMIGEFIRNKNEEILKKVAKKYNLDEKKLIREILEEGEEIDKKRCMGRIWNDGYGGQCSRYVTEEGSEYCRIHSKKLAHGRIDGECPKKLSNVNKVKA
tara:strand:- start:533 stop:868 length:336 start_codon:yes stop_codon:yes gene_type:complete